MPSTPATLIDRWRLGTIPGIWEIAKGYLVERLGNLERILSILHGAVEHPRPSVDARVACSGATSVTGTTPVDVTGATTTITPIVDMIGMIDGEFDIQCTVFASVGHYFLGTLEVNGTPVGYNVVWGCNAVNNRTHTGMKWLVTMKSGTTYVLKMRGATTNAGTQFQVNPTHSGMVVTRIPNVYKPS